MNSERTAPADFIRATVTEDLRTKKCDRVVTRFPPEPNGYQHRSLAQHRRE